MPYETKPLKEDFSICPQDYYPDNGGVIFPNPNAPTGVLMPLEQVEEIIRANQDVVVIVDEAYIDFGGVSALPLPAAAPADTTPVNPKGCGFPDYR